MACVHFGNATVCIPNGQSHRVKPVKRWWSWCFACRQYTWFDLWIFEPEPMSYYGPNLWRQCRECKGQDADLFPGWTRTYEE